MADNMSSRKRGGGKRAENTGSGRKPSANKKQKGQTNNESDLKSEERKTLPPINVFKNEATLIYDFASATQEDISIVAVSVLKRISIRQSHELRKQKLKVFNYWYRHFWFWTGNFMRKPPTPPNGWFQKCVLTQPAMREGEWRPEGWYERFLTCPFAGQQWKPICRVLPNLVQVIEKNKNIEI